MFVPVLKSLLTQRDKLSTKQPIMRASIIFLCGAATLETWHRVFGASVMAALVIVILVGVLASWQNAKEEALRRIHERAKGIVHPPTWLDYIEGRVDEPKKAA